ncbi:uncharacterized protein LOC143293629 [Babylonia areolata]|uniref:uncharacterized protein LOC143293629 n=1 Tax=Babylonia areolata TaxID=304850 RepID=UPI003FCFDC3C
MDKTIVLLLLCSMSCYCTALNMRILGPDNVVLREGGELTLTCSLDKGLAVILDYTFHWVHVPQTGGNTDVVLTNQESMTPDAPDNYGVDFNFVGENTNVSLKISDAVASTDGRYICRAIPSKPDLVQLEKEVTVLVPSNVEQVVLTFDGEEVDVESKVSVQREEGQYGVRCRAKGSNPGPALSLTLDGQPLQTGEPLVELDPSATEAAGARRFKASLSVGKLQLAAAHSGKRIACAATAGFVGASPLVASLPLEVIALEPVITCSQNASGRPGEKYMRLTCRVGHERVEVDHYSFEIGHSGEIVSAKKDSPNYHVIEVKKNVDGMARTDDVTLVLYEAKEEHFGSHFYLDVFLQNGQKFRQTAKFTKRESTGGASRPAAYILCLLLSVLAWSL